MIIKKVVLKLQTIKKLAKTQKIEIKLLIEQIQR